MTAVWYRPLGTTKGPDPRRHAPSAYHLWYRQGTNGRPETTTMGRTDWTHAQRSYDFATMEELVASGIVVQVKEVGSTMRWDEDLDMDEGL